MKKLSALLERGLSLGKLNSIMAVGVILISALLLMATSRTGVQYDHLRTSTAELISWQDSAYELQNASDYLTEQARYFVITGERVYLDNYFEEANVTQRREKALSVLQADIGGSPAYQELEQAMKDSVSLMEREYYTMRLTVEGYGYDLSEYPQEIQDVTLKALDRTLSSGAKQELARRMVFDESYRTQKAAISSAMHRCLRDLVEDTEQKQVFSAEQLKQQLDGQRTLITLMILIVLCIVLLTSLLVISPLIQSVRQIREEQPIPVHGSYEFRFLARTYNQMYEINQESRKHLAYEASHDALTGVYNRSGYDYLMDTLELSRCTLLLVDIDDFKTINDTYGHEVGDQVLTHVAQVLQSNFRSHDYVSRLGGDEFSVMMTNTDPSLSRQIRTKVQRINTLLQSPASGLPPVTVSVGVSFGARDPDRKRLYELADEALYRVKTSGKEGCAFADGSLPVK